VGDTVCGGGYIECMTKDDLIQKLTDIVNNKDKDTEWNHIVADELLLDYIGDDDIRAAFELIDKWYA
jgi:hypothetical protein